MAGGAAPCSFKLRAFEGPLDLLLHLIRINEVEIADIPIAEITDQYLSYLDLMREVDIDLGSEFMLLAATLIHIKTKVLLPQRVEEEEDPRAELVERLLEHQQYQAAAATLAGRQEEAGRYWGRPDAAIAPFLEGGEELIEADLFDLITAFQRVLASVGADAAVEVEQRRFAVEDKMAEIEEALNASPRIHFAELARRYKVKRELIAVFLAVLELMRLRKLRLLQSGTFGEIILVRPKKNRPQN